MNFFYSVLLVIFYSFNSYAYNLCGEFYENIRLKGKELALYEPCNDRIGNEVTKIMRNNLQEKKFDQVSHYALYDLYNLFFDEYLENGNLSKGSYSKINSKYNIGKDKVDIILKIIENNITSHLGIMFYYDVNEEIIRDLDNNLLVYSAEPYSNLSIYIDKFQKGINKLLIINEKETKNLSDLEISELIEKNNKFNLKFDFSGEIYNIDVFKTKIKPRIELFPNIEILSINQIDEKNSSFEMSSIIRSTWYDFRLLEIMKEIYEKEFGNIEQIISNNSDENSMVGGWYCELNSLEEIYDEDLFIWLPQLDVINKVKSNIINEKTTLRFEYSFWSDNEEIMEVSYFQENDLILNTKMNFRSYPFDKQYLDIIVSLNGDYNYSDYVALYPENGFNIETSDFENLFTWNVIKEDFARNFYHHKGSYDGIKISLTAERNANYFVYKILSPIFLILIVCWSVLFIHPRQIESRLTVSIVCFLTLIAYNFVIDQDLPKLGYLTLIDYVVLLSYVYSALPTIISIIEFKYLDKPNIMVINNKIRIIGFISYSLIFYIFLNLTSTKNENINSFLKAITL